MDLQVGRRILKNGLGHGASSGIKPLSRAHNPESAATALSNLLTVSPDTFETAGQRHLS